MQNDAVLSVVSKQQQIERSKLAFSSQGTDLAPEQIDNKLVKKLSDSENRLITL